jgi:hypothetical protein
VRQQLRWPIVHVSCGDAVHPLSRLTAVSGAWPSASALHVEPVRDDIWLVAEGVAQLTAKVEALGF